jgi:hypothetical protein
VAQASSISVFSADGIIMEVVDTLVAPDISIVEVCGD